MAAIDDLKALLITKAGSIAFDLDKAECLADIDSWYNCRVAINALSATDVSSYSIGGRSVTRAQVPQLQSQERALYARILEKLYCTGSALVDLRYPLDVQSTGGS